MKYPFPEELVKQIKEEICKEAREMRQINQTAPVSGERLSIKRPDREISIVLYGAEKENAPLILGFHGGGFLFGGNALNDAMWCAVRKATGAAVASVEYRKSPDYQYQAALEDAYDAAVFFKEHAEEYGIDKTKLSVMGCSAGAQLAASVCLYAKQKGKKLFEYQILMYPMLDSYTDPLSKGPGSLQGPIMYIFNELHCAEEEARLPIVSPVFAAEDELAGLPRAIICYADNDCLKNEGIQYSRMLRNAGVEVYDMLAEGMPHGFFESGFGENAEQGQDFLGEEVVRMIKDGTIAKKSEESLAFIKKYYCR